MTIKHVEYGQLLYDKLISQKLYTVEFIARRTGTPASTIYKYCECTLVVPAGFESKIYNATKDEDFLNFIIDDTDLMLTPKQEGKGEKTVLEETLDVSVACGHLTKTVQKALKDKDINRNERRLIIKSINKAEKELEDLRKKIK